MIKNKRGIVKLGIFFVIIAILLIIFLSILSSASQNLGQYEINDKIKISLRGFGETTLKIQTPSQNLIEKTDKNFFVLELNEPGNYFVDAKSKKRFQRFEFTVVDSNPPKVQEQMQEEIANQDNQIIQINFDNQSNKSAQIKVGQSVKNKQVIQTNSNGKTKVNLPLSATGLSVSDENAKIQEQNNLISNILNQNEKQIVIENINPNQEEIVIEYETPGPIKQETAISENKKQVTISSEEGLHYEDVLAFTTIKEKFYLGEKEQIKVYWKEENVYLDFQVYDTNNNGLIDYIEWIVPHLSTQTFEIILITNAMHLDSEKIIIQDVFDLVGKKDGNFVTIPNQDYLRIKFEKPLVPGKDITLYAQSLDIKEPVLVEVYEKDSDILIATFEAIKEYGQYKVILRDLKQMQDTFDLKVIQGDLQIDYVYDPTETLYVNSYSGTYTGWTEVGSSPYLTDTDDSWIEYRVASSGVLEGNFGFSNSAVGDGIINNVLLYFESSADDAPNDDGFYVWVSNGNASGFTNEGLIQPTSTTYGLSFINVSGKLTSWTHINNAEFYVDSYKVGGTDEVYIRRAYLFIDHDQPDLTAPNITLLTPQKGNETFNPQVYFNASIDEDGEGIKNATLYGNWSSLGWHANETKLIIGSLNYSGFTKILEDGFFAWNVFVCDNSDNCQFNESNNTLRVDTTPPFVNITYPLYGLNYSSGGLDVNYSYYDLGAGIDKCWYSKNNGIANISLSSCKNITTEIWTQGLHNVTVWVNDTLGFENFSYVEFFIDTLGPVAILDTPKTGFLINSTPYLLNASSSYDLGVGIANATWYYSNQTFSWQQIGQDLDYSDEQLTSSWSINLQDGQYNITVNVSDLLGNRNFTTNKNVVIDLYNENPVCTVLYPNGNEKLNKIRFVNASVSEPDPNDVVQNVTFYYSTNNGSSWNLIGTNTTKNLTIYSLSWDTSLDLDSRDYLINCTVIDTRYGNYTDISNSNFTIDNTPPIIYNNYTNETSILINAYVCINSSVSDNIVGIKNVFAEIQVPGVGIENVSLYDNGLGCDLISGDGVYSFAYKSIYEGIYNLSGIHAIDNLNNAIFNFSNYNWSVTSNSYLISNMMYPTTSIEVNESDQNTFFQIQCNITCNETGGNCNAVEVSAEYDSTGLGAWTDILPETLDLINNESVYSCGDILKGESCFRTFNISAGEDSGGNTWDIRCHGESENAAADFSTSQSLHINNNPNAIFSYPSENEWISGTEILNASNSSDLDGTIINYIFEIDDNQEFANPLEICNSGSNLCNLDTKVQQECSNETDNCFLRISVLENDGLRNSTIIQVGIDNIGPTINLDHPLNDSFINISQSQIINATSSDLGSGVNCVEFSVYYDDSWNVINLDCSSPYIYNWDLSLISNQFGIQVRARANDSENNFGTYETHGNITYDSNSPTVNLYHPENNSIFSVNQMIFNFTQNDSFSNYSNCGIYLNNVFNQSNSSTQNNTLTNTDIQYFSQGTYSWFVNCTDDAGNVGMSEVNYFSIDLSPPTWLNQNQSRGLRPINRYYKGQAINLSSYWEDNYKLGNATLSTNETGFWENKTLNYGSPKKIIGGNLTSFFWSNSSLENGTYVSWRIFGNDSAGNTNVTDILDFRVWGYSEISSSYLYPLGIPEGGTTTMYCGIRDNVSLGVLEGYSVSFYDEGVFLGTNTTKVGGFAEWTFSKATAGGYTITCNITDHNSIYYSASGKNQGQANLGVGYGLQVYDYTNTTFHRAFEGSTTNPTTPVPTYASLEYYDGFTETHTVDQTGAYAYQKFILKVDQSEQQLIDFNLTWIGYGLVTGTGTDGFIIYLWNETLGNWQTLITYTGGDTEQIRSIYNATGFEDYINSTGFVQVLVRTFSPDSRNQDTVTVGTNYIKLELKYDILPPRVTLHAPVNYLNTSNTTLNFNCSVLDDQNIANVSLKTNFNGEFEINETNPSGVNNVNYSFTKIPSEGTYLWNCYACDESGICGFAESNYTITVDTTPPKVNLVYPENNTNFSSYYIDFFNYTVSDTNNIANCSLYGDWINGWHLNKTNFNPIRNVNQNFSNNNVSQDGYYVWNVLCFDYSGNSAFNSTNFSFSAFYPVKGLNVSQINVSQTNSDGTGDVILNWGSSEHNENYYIYTSETPNGPFTYLDQTTQNTYTDTTARNSRRRFYKVSSVNPISENISDRVFGKTVYSLKRKPGVNSRNWMSLYLESNLSSASQALRDIVNTTAFSYWNSTLQLRVTCNGFSCPSFPGCPENNCDFNLVDGIGYEVHANATDAIISNWSQVGSIKPPVTIDLIKNSTSFGKNWIGIYGNTSLTDANSLYTTLSFVDTMTNWDSSEQISIPYIPYPWPWLPLLGENFVIEPEKAYEVSATQDTTYTQT